MGTGASTNPDVGVPANPRVVYTDELAKKERQAFILDTPVLIDVQHGSIRYRYSTKSGDPRDKSKRKEKPHEGAETTGKKDYFYHARLTDFSSQAARDKEDDFKFLCVTKAPARAQGKKLYYVYGRGMGAKDGIKVKPTQTKQAGQDYTWPAETRPNPNDLYYTLSFLQQDKELENTEELSDRLVNDLDSTPDKSRIKLVVAREDTVSALKAKLAVKLLKAAGNLHICHKEVDLRNDQTVAELRSAEDGDWNVFEVQLDLI